MTGALDPRTIQNFVGVHKSGIHYISMPTDVNAAEQVDSEGLGKSLKAVTALYPVTVIDGGNDLSDLTVKALEFSTLIFLVVSPDLLAVNQTKRLYTELVTMLFPKDMIQIVLSGYQKGHPVSPEVVGKQIGKPVFAVIPKDDQTCTMALSRSTPIMVAAKNSAFAKGVTDCSRKLIQKNVLKSLEKLNKQEIKKKDDKKEKTQKVKAPAKTHGEN